MLTFADYSAFWTNPMPHGFGMPAHLLPCYYQYLQREVYFNDYLDLFRKQKRISFPRVPVKGKLYIYPGFPIVHCPPYTIQHEGKVLLAVAKYPYENQVDAECIEYILIGEAAPPDIINYFYNVNGTKATPYFSAPCKAFGVVGKTKKEKLIGLAKKGVLLIDLYPFPINYGQKIRGKTIRDTLIDANVPECFWEDRHNPNSLHTRNATIRESLFCKEVNKPNAVIVAPTNLSHHLGQKLNSITPISHLGLNFRLNENTFLPPHIHSTAAFFIHIPPHTHLVSLSPLIPDYPLLSLSRVPYYCCCAYSGSNIGPHELFIRNGLGLP